MKKKLLVLFIVLLLAFALCACSNEEANAPEVSDDEPTTSKQPTDLIFPVIEEDYWEIFDNRCNMIYEPCFCGMIRIDLTLLSAVPLEEGDVIVTADDSYYLNCSFDPYDMEVGKCTMYEDIFLLYQGVSIQELISYQERSDDISTERQTEIYDLVKAFRALDESEKPTIYKYILYVGISPETNDYAELTVNSITVTVNGETRDYDLGTLSFRKSNTEVLKYDPDFNLNCDDNISSFGDSVGINSTGTFRLNNIKYNAVEDVTITGLSFYNAYDVKIKSVSITETTADGATIDTAWDTKKPIKLSAGESIILNIEIADPFFANTLGGWDIRYLVIEYQCKGNTYEQPITFQCHQTLDDPFAYIAMEDGIDILSFYTDYINRNRAY